MTVLILIFLALTGSAPPPQDGVTPPAVSTEDGATGEAAGTTTDDGGEYVRKSPIG